MVNKTLQLRHEKSLYIETEFMIQQVGFGADFKKTLKKKDGTGRGLRQTGLLIVLKTISFI